MIRKATQEDSIGDIPSGTVIVTSSNDVFLFVGCDERRGVWLEPNGLVKVGSKSISDDSRVYKTYRVIEVQK